MLAPLRQAIITLRYRILHPKPDREGTVEVEHILRDFGLRGSAARPPRGTRRSLAIEVPRTPCRRTSQNPPSRHFGEKGQEEKDQAFHTLSRPPQAYEGYISTAHPVA